MTDKKTTISIAGVTLTVPIHKNKQHTQRVVADIEKRLKDIQDRSRRIDTQAFALQAAYELAVELDRTTQSRRETAEQILDTLQDILQTLDELIAASQGQNIQPLRPL